ncbi:MAG: hypothetical protein KatS3mg068_0452 [Candidatus Sericytochromatia bacterium]|nr:MAG: hypothetical protein KatS3mg068_0452 [Candidatus Sericytochromatia bacterium]
MSNNFINTLGIDLSIGKVKLCLLSLDKENKFITGAWTSLPVEFEYIDEKNYEFSKGLSIAIEAFLKHHNLNVESIKSTIFCTGGAYYMFKSFIDGLIYTASVLKMIFNRQKVYFIRCDGKLFKLREIFDISEKEASAFNSTNFLGTSILATKIFDEGLAIDMGTISTSIIPIINREIDPNAKLNPSGYTKHRYITGKHIWYGSMHTPLNYITTSVKTNKGFYNLILRSCSTNTLCNILGILPSSVANVHVSNKNSKIQDDDNLSYIQMAETLGLDIYSISKEELYEVAKNIYYIMIYKLSEIIRNIVNNTNFSSFENLKVLSCGLGQNAFIVPALLNAGFDKSQIITIEEDKESNLWTATSVYGLAIKAMEDIIKEPLNVDFKDLNS